MLFPLERELLNYPAKRAEVKKKPNGCPAVTLKDEAAATREPPSAWVGLHAIGSEEPMGWAHRAGVRRRSGGASAPAAAGRPRRRGIALILTLLTLAILILLVMQLRVTTRLHVIQARNFTGDLQNSHGARAALEFARLYIQTDTELAPTVDTLHEPWARPFQIPDLPDASVEVRIEDEERRFNLGRLVRPDGKPNPVGRAQLRRLVAVLGIPDDTLADRIADYVDPDTEGAFEAGARNRMPVIPEELGMIQGIPPAFLYGGVNPQTKQPFAGILDFLTIWPEPQRGAVMPDSSGSRPPPTPGTPPPSPDATPTPPDATPKPPVPPPPGKAPIGFARVGVNINTAPLQVLLALSEEMTPEIAQGIVSYREGADAAGKPVIFNSVSDLLKVPGVTQRLIDSLRGELVFRSTVFSVRVVCRSHSMTRRVRFVLGRGMGGKPPPLLTWWEEGGAFGLPAQEEFQGGIGLPSAPAPLPGVR